VTWRGVANGRCWINWKSPRATSRWWHTRSRRTADGPLSVMPRPVRAGSRSLAPYAPLLLTPLPPSLHSSLFPCFPPSFPPFSFSCAHSPLLGLSHAGASRERAHTLTCTCNRQVERECPEGWRAIVESIEYRDMIVESIQYHDARQSSPHVANPMSPELQAGLLDAMRATVAAAREMKTLVFAKVREWQEQELASRRAARQHHLARHAQ